MELRIKFLLVLMFGVALIGRAGANDANSDNGNSQEDVEDDTSTADHKSTADSKETFRNLVRPFRMEKLNLIWVKAQQVNKW